MSHLNVEIKARSNDHDNIKDILQSSNAVFIGVDNQVDTYFKVERGRLKLREGNIENHLIYYNRENKSEPKQSDVILYKPNPVSGLKEILTNALEILIVVEKRREIYFIENVKFHLDYVKNLGTFIEIEAIDLEGQIGAEKLHEQCNHFLNLCKIKDGDLISVSYSDMLFTKS